MNKPKTITVTVQLPPDMHSDLKQRASDRLLSLSDIIREALVAYLKSDITPNTTK